MGKYIDETTKGPMPSALGKAEELIKDGATLIGEPVEWSDDLVCVVDNGMFEAAGYAYSKEEMEVFKRPDGRFKQWLKYPNAKQFAK